MTTLTSPAPAEETSGKAVAAFVFGILGLCQILPCIGPIAALWLGQGESSALGKAGRILGWVTLGLYAFALVAIGLLAAAFGMAIPFLD